MSNSVVRSAFRGRGISSVGSALADDPDVYFRSGADGFFPFPVRRLRAQLHRFSREHVYMVEEPLFYSMDGATLGKDLLKVLCRIAREKGRVEITNCEGHSCVMISKEELDLIESALEILSNLHEVQLLHDKVKHVLTLDDETQPVPEVRLAAAEQAG